MLLYYRFCIHSIIYTLIHTLVSVTTSQGAACSSGTLIIHTFIPWWCSIRSKECLAQWLFHLPTAGSGIETVTSKPWTTPPPAHHQMLERMLHILVEYNAAHEMELCITKSSPPLYKLPSAPWKFSCSACHVFQLSGGTCEWQEYWQAVRNWFGTIRASVG